MMSPLTIYNSLTRKKEEFQPAGKSKVKMYTCGQTVYNDIHMGNARFYVAFDAIRRILEVRGYRVKYVQNFTDIDDKIIAKAKEEGCTVKELADKYIQRTRQDLAALNVHPPDISPRATEEIDEIIKMTSELIEKSYAYEKNGNVYFNIKSFKKYGKLSGKKIDELEAGARVEVENEKINPADFVLWKPSKEGEPSWPSPWGNGRPGWHIECSAMAKKYLGKQIDIHGGGSDLIFPHHENEIAQTEAITGRKFAKYWMHSGILTTNHRKMSKSSENFFTVREVAEKFSYDVIRFYILSGHYRMPMEFSDEVLKAAEQGLQRIRNCYKDMHHALENTDGQLGADFTGLIIEFEDALNDDFNTADAISVIFKFVKFMNSGIKKDADRQFLETGIEILKHFARTLGIHLIPAEKTINKKLKEEVEVLLIARNEAKKEKNFAEADRIRNQLIEMGVVIEDTREGVRWHRA